MTIVCLGWGSLVWDPRTLPLRGDWKTDGPVLPLEFARQSQDGRITLVITEDGAPCPALWGELDAATLDEAVAALAAREGCAPTAIGRWPSATTVFAQADAISAWAGRRGIAGVVWTALSPGLARSRGAVPALGYVVDHLRTLKGEAREAAQTYVARAPLQVATRYRPALEAELGIARDAGAAPRPGTSRGDEMLTVLANSLRTLEDKRLTGYDDADLRREIADLGSRAERFFKAVVFPGMDPDDSLDTAINRLKAAGVAKDIRSQLHQLRELYNDAKHDPTKRILLKDAIDVVAAARSAMAQVIALGLGQVAIAAQTAVNRLLWVSGYDSYTTGSTAVYVSLPVPNDVFATHLDVFELHYSSWDPLKADLLAGGQFFYGPEHFDKAQYDSFNEDDFIGAGIWDGDYRTLVRTLARHEHRQSTDALIPGLRRDHMTISVFSGIALAAVDVANAAGTALDEAALTDAILKCADTVYALPAKTPWVRETAQALARMVIAVPFPAWRALSGPYWNLWAPKALATQVTSPDPKRLPVVIDDANRVVITA